MDKIENLRLHNWVRKVKGRATFCWVNKEHRAKCYDWANISRKYTKEKGDFIALCRPCHRVFDEEKLTIDQLFMREKMRQLFIVKSAGF